MACDILLTLSGPGFLSSVPTWAEVSGNLFSMVCLFLSPFAHCEQLFWFSFFILMPRIAKEALQRFLLSLKESGGANTEATMNMYYCKYRRSQCLPS